MENYLFLDGISNRLGFRRVACLSCQKKGKANIKENHTFWKHIETVVKLASYFLIIPPLICCAGKFIYRKIHQASLSQNQHTNFLSLRIKNLNPTTPLSLSPSPSPYRPKTAPSPKANQTKLPMARTDGIVSDPPGFPNFGNTCWFNSSLQILCADKPFMDIVQKPLVHRPARVNSRNQSIPE